MENIKKINEFLSVCNTDKSMDYYLHNIYLPTTNFGDDDGNGGISYGHDSESGHGFDSTTQDEMGFGYGGGIGHGNSEGFTHNSGAGTRNGNGWGFGDQSYNDSLIAFISYNGQLIYHICNKYIIIDKVCGEIAKGRIIYADMTTEDCYVAKQKNSFTICKTKNDAIAIVGEE